MEETRVRARTALSQVLAAAPPQRSRPCWEAVEVSVYNACIRNAEALCIPRCWGNDSFRRMYNAKIRTLLYNLHNPANPTLLRQAETGHLPPRTLATLTPQQMFPDLWEEALHKRLLRDVDTTPGDVPDGLVTCKKCGSRKVVWGTRQTRSSDEASTVFASCTQCKFRFRFSA